MGSRWEIALRCECSERRLGFQTIMNRTLAIIVLMLLLAAASHAEAPAESLLSAGRVDLEIVNLQNRIRQSPSDSEAYHLLSRAYFSLRRWDDSINAARKAVAIEPNNSDYHL